MKFNPQVVKEDIFTPDMVMKEWWGGDREFVYEHEKYWPALVKMCNERRTQQMEKWRELGGTVGLKEWDVRGGRSVIENDGKVEGVVVGGKEVNT